MTIAEQLRQEGHVKGMEIGRQEGRQETVLQTAIKMKSLSLPVDVILQVTGLSMDEIRRLERPDGSEGISC